MQHGFRIGFFHKLAAHKESKALVAVALAKMQTRHNAVVGGDAKARMRGFYRVKLQRGKAAQGSEQFFADIGIFHGGQAGKGDGWAFDKPVDLLKGRVLGKA